MANPIDETGAVYISKLNVKGTAYTIKDAWVRAEVEEVKSAIAGGVHFRGVSTTAIADGDNVKDLTVNGNTYAAATQVDGDLFIYYNGKKNLEFVVSGGKYSEFGSTGELGALAFADTASGSVEVPIAAAITFETFTPNVSNGTLAVTTTAGTSLGITTAETAASASAKFSPAAITVAEKGCSITTAKTAASAEAKFTPADTTVAAAACSITTEATAATAAVTFSPAAITVAAKTCDVTTAKSTFAALSDVTYDSTTATLSISSVTSDAFVTGVTVTAPSQTISQDANQSATVKVTYDKVTAVTSAAQTITYAEQAVTVEVTYDKVTAVTAPSQTVSQDANQTVTVAVTYDKATGTTGSYLTGADLTGAIAVTGAAPTATITNPTITVTVSPVA